MLTHTLVFGPQTSLEPEVVSRITLLVIKGRLVSCNQAPTSLHELLDDTNTLIAQSCYVRKDQNLVLCQFFRCEVGLCDHLDGPVIVGQRFVPAPEVVQVAFRMVSTVPVPGAF